MRSLPGLKPSPWCPGPRARLAGGRGEPRTARLPGQGRDLGAGPPHTRVPIAARAGRLCAGRDERARPNAACPGAQTWPAGRDVPSHASGSVLLLPGLRDSTRARPRLPAHTAVLVGGTKLWEQPGRGGRSGCSAVLVSQSPAGSREAHAGKSMQLAQHHQERGPGCHSESSVPTRVARSTPSAGQLGAGAAGQEWDDARQHVGYSTWQ